MCRMCPIHYKLSVFISNGLQMRAIRKFKGLLGPKGVAHPPQDPIPEPSSLDSSASTLRPPMAAAGSTKQDLVDASASTSTEDEVSRIIRERQELMKANGGRLGIKAAFGKPGIGQAHDITNAVPLHLGIGTGAVDDFAGDQQPPADSVSDSPTAVEFNIYDRAFDAEIERIKRSTSRKASGKGGAGGGVEVYHTRLNSYGQRHYKTAEKGDDENLIVVEGGDKIPRSEQEIAGPTERKGQRFADLAAQVFFEARNKENAAPGGGVIAGVADGAGQ